MELPDKHWFKIDLSKQEASDIITGLKDKDESCILPFLNRKNRPQGSGASQFGGTSNLAKAVIEALSGRHFKNPHLQAKVEKLLEMANESIKGGKSFAKAA